MMTCFFILSLRVYINTIEEVECISYKGNEIYFLIEFGIDIKLQCFSRIHKSRDSLYFYGYLLLAL